MEADTHRWTGRPVARSEDRPLVTGAADFTADLDDPLLAGAAAVVFVRSPHAAATITGIDIDEAREAPGVLAVIGPADLDGLHPAPFAPPVSTDHPHPVLPADEVRFAGQPVAAVVATTYAAAVDAAELVIVDYEPRPPLLDLDRALAETPLDDTRVVADHDPGPFDGADVVVTHRTWNPRQSPAPIEPRTVAAAWDGDRLRVWAATQTPHKYRDQLATFLGIDPASVHVTAPAVGGGFGGKTSRGPEEYVVPLAARLVGRPLRWVETRSENLVAAPHGRAERVELTVAGTGDGRITALRAEVVKDGGAYPLVGVLLPAGYTRPMAPGCYDIAHVEFSSVAVLTNRPPTAAYRGAGRGPYVDALERAVDRFAARVGLDPAEVRRRNLIRPHQLPYATATGGRYDEADYPGDLERALVAAGYDRLRREQAERRQRGDRDQLGIGVACYNHMTTGGGGEEAAVAVEPDGGVVVTTGTTSQGHGHATTWAQIAADVLAVDPAVVRVVEGDTDAIATGVGAVGSRSLQTAGMAVHNSASAVLERARRLAAAQLEASPDDVVASPGVGLHVVGTPAVAVTWAELAAQGLGTADELQCGEVYDTEGRNTFPSGCHVAVVTVDVEIGSWTLDRLVAVDDAGARVNPIIVDGQLHGGIASGVGQVQGEVHRWDERGNPLTATFLDYPIPTADQLPSFELHGTATRSSFNTEGWKGVGESGTIGATAAVHNGVVDAVAHLGVDHIDLPCTPDRVWKAITDAQLTGGAGASITGS